ncbi:hypothetical protein WNY63_01485 [Pseudoalteromonas neustonica]|uniref:Uncharacterized protein n=1 Tax=Pseudoalteromonas neustonica TaxID=1840331 RepID=A0ABU9TXA2_9GAMM
MHDVAAGYSQVYKINSLHEFKDSLSNLLIDSVNCRASIGFIAPLTHKNADQYWYSIENDLLGRADLCGLKFVQSRGDLIAPRKNPLGSACLAFILSYRLFMGNITHHSRCLA